MIDPESKLLVITTAAVAFETFAMLVLVVTDVVPGATLVTATFTVDAPAAKVTLEGTVATAGLLEARLTVSADGAGPERFNAKFCGPGALIVRIRGVKLKTPFTMTVLVAEV